MDLNAFFLGYFGKEKCDSFAKFATEKGLTGQDLFEAAKSTKWKIDQGNITTEGATAYMWKILWNKFRAQLGAYAPPEEPKDPKVSYIEPDTMRRRPSRAPVFYPKVNKPEEPPKPIKKRRINFDEE